MVEWSALSSILSARNGVWTLVVLVMVGLWRGWAGLPAVMAQWIERRRVIAAEKAADWERLRAENSRFAERLHVVEERHDECERNLAAERQQRHADVSSLRNELADAKGRLREIEGYMMGQGKARQDAAGIVAIERLADRKKTDKDRGK